MSLKIAPFAPSSPPDPQKIKEGLEIIDIEGPELIWTRDPFGPTSRSGPFDYLAEDDEVQAARFSKYMQDVSNDFIWTMRGGYGSSRWIDKIDWGRVAGSAHPLIIGFSDITF
ncbi:MAG: LD-carboxypeptidase, partial [Dissulfurimicrobium sp.]